MVGSNAFAHEEFEGIRRHAIEHYPHLVRDGRIDLTAMVTHRFALEEWWEAPKALSRPEESGVLKATLTPNPAPVGPAAA